MCPRDCRNLHHPPLSKQPPYPPKSRLRTRIFLIPYYDPLQRPPTTSLPPRLPPFTLVILMTNRSLPCGVMPAMRAEPACHVTSKCSVDDRNATDWEFSEVGGRRVAPMKAVLP
ncbi:hypothetical protein L873DRAFT_1823134 [Choiromyces venosus 120613-1]|uniref:Uncharacterized protein n=1 Tax=Choiromyces venosus 120613-1 TaxID=1336337 RepID=A0A3N4IWV3_9PEZI|nr:hypothetical protein L873DRAFT_1823134 [Choiromyces venosus 120613-1]